MISVQVSNNFYTLLIQKVFQLKFFLYLIFCSYMQTVIEILIKAIIESYVHTL